MAEFDVSILGKFLVAVGVVLVIVGVTLIYRDKLPFIEHLGKLPGDINIKKEGFSFHFPIVTSIIASIVLSFVLWLLGKK
ncbi:MAG: DUF2905 domain-containing protein [Bacteriovoracaceae bacterium]|nr:DUF2905 domain-containing protein [Bacteriovoracaceae bacterium]